MRKNKIYNNYIMVNRKQVLNFGREINMYYKSPEEINDEVQRYLKLNNVGKYLIFRDDSGEAQTDTYIVCQIINEDPKGRYPLISLKEIGYDTVYGGRKTMRKVTIKKGKGNKSVTKFSYRRKNTKRNIKGRRY